MNVAITRARKHVAVVCDSSTICHNTFLARLLRHIRYFGRVKHAEPGSFGGSGLGMDPMLPSISWVHITHLIWIWYAPTGNWFGGELNTDAWFLSYPESAFESIYVQQVFHFCVCYYWTDLYINSKKKILNCIRFWSSSNFNENSTSSILSLEVVFMTMKRKTGYALEGEAKSFLLQLKVQPSFSRVYYLWKLKLLTCKFVTKSIDNSWILPYLKC